MMPEGGEIKAEDSDYYTPEDPHTTILSPVKSPSDPIEKVSSNALLHKSDFIDQIPLRKIL